MRIVDVIIFRLSIYQVNSNVNNSIKGCIKRAVVY
jgi:hypothetical protein